MSTELIERWSTATRAYLDGDLRTYARLAHHTADYTLIPPNGGDPRHGFDGSEEAVAWTARTFRGGSADLEVFHSYVEGDLAVLVAVERQHATIADLPDQEWSLRITLVFRRGDGEWRLVHRHADPLVREISEPQLTALLRGDANTAP